MILTFLQNSETNILMGQSSQDSPTIEKPEQRKDTSKTSEPTTCPHYLILNIIMR